jgi:hypothetical protein
MRAHDPTFGPRGRRFRPGIEALELRDLPSGVLVHGAQSSGDHGVGPYLNLIVEMGSRHTPPSRDDRLARRHYRAPRPDRRLGNIELARRELHQKIRDERIDDRLDGAHRNPVFVAT